MRRIGVPDIGNENDAQGCSEDRALIALSAASQWRAEGGACIPPLPSAPYEFGIHRAWHRPVNNLIYLIGLIVVVLAILSFFGLR
jgi:hypothetical protein